MADAFPTPKVIEMRPMLAWRMALLAFLHFNIGLGVIWGSFSVVLTAVETRLGVGRTASTIAVPLLTLVSALLAPPLGSLLTRFSLRTTALAGAALTVAGFFILAWVNTYTAYLIAFAVFLGPGQAVAVICPTTLVTRWFPGSRGRALGVVCSPVIIAVLPLLTSGVLQRFGLPTTYLMLASLSAILIFSGLFISDHPKASCPKLEEFVGSRETVETAPIGTILRQSTFWCLLAAIIPLIEGAIVLSAHMVPIARSWGFSTTAAAALLAIQSAAGIVGTIAFGYLADWLGGTRTVALMGLGCALLWSSLLLSPSFATASLLVGLIGMHSAGVTPVSSFALAEVVGASNFSRAFGITQLLTLPFSVAAPTVSALIYSSSGSYKYVLIAQIVLFVIGSPFAIAAWGASRKVGFHVLREGDSIILDD